MIIKLAYKDFKRAITKMFRNLKEEKTNIKCKRESKYYFFSRNDKIYRMKNSLNGFKSTLVKHCRRK